MIIFGARTKILNGSTATTNCSNCGSAQTVRLSFALRYFHIFWIPMFPISKTGISQCSHCKQVLYANEMPNDLKTVYNQEKAKAKIPWGYRFGLILIGLFFALMIFSMLFGGANKEYVKTAQINDVYQIKEGSENYTLYKVIKVEGDIITVVKNKQFASKISQLNQLVVDAKNDYTTNEMKFSKTELENMIANRSLLEIDREK
jgi:hypothetical protein